MRTNLIEPILKGLFYMVVISCLVISCRPKSEQNTLPIVRDQIAEGGDKGYAPLSHPEHDSLIEGRKSAFRIVSGTTPLTPTFTDVFISVPALKQYIDTNRIGGAYDSLRIYPALGNNILFFIFCLDNNSDQSEKAFMLLNKKEYSQIESLPLIDDVTYLPSCSTAHANYMNRVLVNGENQSDVNDSTIRYSRLYAIRDIYELISDNVTGTTRDENELTFKFEFGYINKNMSTVLNSRGGGFSIPQHQGFTCMISLYDKDKQPIIKKDKEFGDPRDFKDLYLEVGNPCPPRCGVLHDM